MIPVSLALLSALAYGSGDFLGGLATRRLTVLPATAAAAASGLVLLVVLAPLVGFEWVASDLAWGALSGLFGVAALVLLYACLAVGPMSILSPLTAVVSAVAPMLWGLTIGGETLAVSGYIGLGVAVVAVVLVGLVPEGDAVRPTARALLMAVGSGIAIGGMLICLDRTGDAGGLTPLVANRAVNTLITGVLALAVLRRRDARPTGAGHAPWLALGCGLADATANVLLLLALRAGSLAVVSPLTAFYPAGTIMLAALVLRERTAPVQWAGIGLALGAGVLLGVS